MERSGGAGAHGGRGTLEDLGAGPGGYVAAVRSAEAQLALQRANATVDLTAHADYTHASSAFQPFDHTLALSLSVPIAVHDRNQGNIARAEPGVTLDGVLVEAMAEKGLELMVGAKRDPAWGPVLLMGLGGIWVEALGDVRLVSATATQSTILEELQKLRTAKLLNGFRGQPAVDVEAVAQTVMQIGRLMLTEPSIVEVDINPLVALPKGKGVLALDALIVTQ